MSSIIRDPIDRSDKDIKMKRQHARIWTWFNDRARCDNTCCTIEKFIFLSDILFFCQVLVVSTLTARFSCLSLSPLTWPLWQDKRISRKRPFVDSVFLFPCWKFWLYCHLLLKKLTGECTQVWKSWLFFSSPWLAHSSIHDCRIAGHETAGRFLFYRCIYKRLEHWMRWSSNYSDSL